MICDEYNSKVGHQILKSLGTQVYFNIVSEVIFKRFYTVPENWIVMNPLLELVFNKISLECIITTH